MSILMGAMGLGQALTDMADVKEGRAATNRVLDLIYSPTPTIDALSPAGAKLKDVKGEIEVGGEGEGEGGGLGPKAFCLTVPFLEPYAVPPCLPPSLSPSLAPSSKTSASGTPPASTSMCLGVRTRPAASPSVFLPARPSPSWGPPARGKARPWPSPSDSTTRRMDGSPWTDMI